MNEPLACALAGCGKFAETIYCGFALCHTHWVMTDELPDQWQYDPRAIMTILAGVDDELYLFTDEPDELTRQTKALQAACQHYGKRGQP
jgi:hypothetical protein